MPTVDDFRSGERVAHVTLGDGVVDPVEGGVVVVHYKTGVIGKYDRRWFELNPRFIFHRSAA